MSNAGDDAKQQRKYRAIHAPLSEFFDAYVVIGYTAGSHDRLVMVNAPDNVAADGLREPCAAAAAWINAGGAR